jgi:signal recognition particle subunit SRP68
VHAYITYQLLARRSQRDLQLTTALLSTSSTPLLGLPKSSTTKAPPVDSRLFPAVVKLLDSVLQSLEQMRVLSVVDESSENIASAIDARISFTKARR